MEYAGKEVALVILKTVSEKEGLMGVGKLALLLKGSASKRVKGDNAEFKSAIFWQPIDVIENFIKQLVQKGLLEVRTIGFYPNLRPVLYVSDKGKTAIGGKAEILLEILRKEKEVKLNEPMQLTLEAFSRLKSIEAVANERGIAVSTVWKHLIGLCMLGMIKPEAVISLELKERILEAAKGKSKVGEIKALLPYISYEEIRLALADRKKEKQ
ncbi:MAG: helix-turn-helix domain-containing protein [Nanoarchaeota archaeon]|nr:helix-turn-helix domain-containing protein [Nanoarchaeota archaeon]